MTTPSDPNDVVAFVEPAYLWLAILLGGIPSRACGRSIIVLFATSLACDRYIATYLAFSKAFTGQPWRN